MNVISTLRMKLFLTLLLGLLVFGQASARCGDPGLSVFPKNGVIKPNSWILISSGGSGRDVVNSLNQDFPVYLLQGNGDTLALKVIQIETGQHDSPIQAMLKPVENLIVGQSYSLQIDGLDKYQEKILFKSYTSIDKAAKISWTVRGEPDSLKPLSLAEPTFIDKSAFYWSCGSSAWANFKISAQDQSSLLVETELLEVATGKSHTFHLGLGADGIVGVGHSMCGGVFDFTVTGLYKVRFRLMDICGNKNASWSGWTEFKSPFEEVGERPH